MLAASLAAQPPPSFSLRSITAPLGFVCRVGCGFTTTVWSLLVKVVDSLGPDVFSQSTD